MQTRFTWFLAVLALISIGFIVACSTKYSSSSNGLIVVPSRDQIVMETFSLNLTNGGTAQINNVNGPLIPGLPSSVVHDPAGEYAYVIVTQSPQLPAGSENQTGIASFKIDSDGKLEAAVVQTLNGEQIYNSGPPPNLPESVAAVPVALAMDSAGKFLFVADSATSDSSGAAIPGAVSVFSVSSGVLTEVPNSPFVLPVLGVPSLSPAPCTPSALCASASALAVTPTSFPAQFAVCSNFTPPATENLYVADSIDNTLINYSITSTGSLSFVTTGANPIPTGGTLPSSVVVDPCNRYVYAANATTNNVSGFTICTTIISGTCTFADYSLQPISGSPYGVGDAPGPMAIDPSANFIYIVATGSDQLSWFRISSATGKLANLAGGTVATGLGPNSIAIRGDDTWVFVSNLNAATVSQYALAPATGVLTPQNQPISTYTYPSGVVVK